MQPAPGSPDDPTTDGESTTVYVSIELPADAIPGGLAEIQQALDDAARTLTRSGHPVRYVNGMYLPAQARLLCVFAGESEEAVHAAVGLLRLPFAHIQTVGNDHGPAPENGEPGR